MTGPSAPAGDDPAICFDKLCNDANIVSLKRDTSAPCRFTGTCHDRARVRSARLLQVGVEKRSYAVFADLTAMRPAWAFAAQPQPGDPTGPEFNHSLRFVKRRVASLARPRVRRHRRTCGRPLPQATTFRSPSDFTEASATVTAAVAIANVCVADLIAPVSS